MKKIPQERYLRNAIMTALMNIFAEQNGTIGIRSMGLRHYGVNNDCLYRHWTLLPFQRREAKDQ